MQFDPERYPVKDFKFITTSSLGIIAREYEVTQLVQLLQTMSPESPMYPLLIESIVDNMNLSNREEIIASLRKANEPDPEQQAMQQQAMEMDMAQKQASLQNYQAQTEEIQSRIRQNEVEPQLLPADSQTKRMEVMLKGAVETDETDKEFDRRARLAELVLKEREIASKEDIVERQMRQYDSN